MSRIIFIPEGKAIQRLDKPFVIEGPKRFMHNSSIKLPQTFTDGSFWHYEGQDPKVEEKLEKKRKALKPKAEKKVELKAEKKVELKAEPKAEKKVELKSELKAEKKEVKFEVKAEPKVELKAEKKEVKLEVKTKEEKSNGSKDVTLSPAKGTAQKDEDKKVSDGAKEGNKS